MLNTHYIRKVPELPAHDWLNTKVRQESSFAPSIGEGSMGKLYQFEEFSCMFCFVPD